MDSEVKNRSRPESNPVPKWWIFVVLISLWLMIGLLPHIAVWIGNTWGSLVSADRLEVAGTIGDSFGLANSLFSAVALGFVIWNLFIQSRQIKETNERHEESVASINKQIELMRAGATLSSIGHIYEHYGPEYGKHDDSGVLGAVAEGHRRWAIRESFSIIDPALEHHRIIQVDREFAALKQMLSPGNEHAIDFRIVARALGSLLLDKRLDPAQRARLWGLYESVREGPSQLLQRESAVHLRFMQAREELFDGQPSTASKVDKSLQLT